MDVDLLSNHAVLLTAPGTAAIAVVRLIGPAVDAFVADHFSKPLPPGRCVHGLLTDGDQTIDDALAVRCAANVVDLNLHGGAWVVQATLNLVEASGFQISNARTSPGVIDAPTEIWHEVLAALPLAKTEAATRMLLAQPVAWENITDPATVLADHSGQWLISTPRVAIVGPANVGKSTLANQMFGQARSITADLPGTTRDWVGEIANIDGLAIMLVDTPGIRTTDDPIERAAIAGSAAPIATADLVVLVLDQSLAMDKKMLNAYPTAIRIANKSDAQAKWDAASINAICTVATTGRGVGDLRRAIRNRFGWEPIKIDQPRWWTERQRKLLHDHLNNDGNL